jgi:AcrR family transcriptional regulator
MPTSELPQTKTAPSLRQRQKANTIKLILDAVGRCLRDISLAELSFSLIAREAGIGERTVYRYFPTRDALFDAFWQAYMQSIQPPLPLDARSLLSAAQRIFPKFDEYADITRSFVTSPEGRAIAQLANKRRVSTFKPAVREAVGDLPEAELIRLCACVQALLSPGTWLQMREVWGLDGQESGRAVAEAIKILLGAGRRTANSAKRVKSSR